MNEVVGKRHCCVVLAVLLMGTAVGRLVLLPTVVAAQPSVDRIVAAADSLLLSLHQRGLFNGAVVLSRGEEEIYARGFGPANAEAGVPFTPDTPADGGSIAKTLAAASLFMLVEEGRLSLDDPVRQHLPAYPHEATRVRHLIAHTAGLPGYEALDAFLPADQVKTTARYLDVLRERHIEPAFAPGTRFRYDNLAFDVAALLVERVTGKGWDEFLRERVFDPLKMEATFLRPARLADWPGVRTMSYRQRGDSLALYDVFDNEGFYGGSNLYFSARDLSRWSRSFYLHPVLSKAALTVGREPPVLDDPATGAGGPSGLTLLSWYYPSEGQRFHYPGSLQGFWSYAYRDEDRRYTIVYVSNNNIPQGLRPLLLRALIDIMEGRPPPPLDPPAFADLDGANLNPIAGRYRVEPLGTVILAASNNQASVRIEDSIEYPAYFVGHGLLYVPGLDAWIGFRDTPAEPFRHLTWRSVFCLDEGERIR